MVAVTKLIDLLNKPALVYWSNKIGLSGVSLKDYRIDSSNKGTSKHDEVENYIKNGVLFKDYIKLDKVLKDYVVIGCEVEIKTNNLIGRADLILEKENKKYIIDFKSSNNIYLSTKLQLSTYKNMFNADYIGVIDLNNFKLTLLDINTDKYYEIIKRLFQINELLNFLKERL